MALQEAIEQWHRGERRLACAPAERSALLERVTANLVAELRRRLGGRFTARELAEFYEHGTSWCVEFAMRQAPDAPWAWDPTVVVDAAFGRYLRAAADYAGGRLDETLA